MKLIFFLLIVFFLFSTSCKKKKKCSRGYDLEHPVSVYPVKPSYSIGDTIWFEMNFSDYFDAVVTNNFIGQQSNQTIQLKDFDFHRNYLFFQKLIDTAQNLNGQSSNTWIDFTPIYEIGTIVHEHKSGPEYRLDYSIGQYRMKIGIICNEPGFFVYRPGFGHYYSNAEGQMNEQDLTPECEREIITNIYFPVNRQTNGTYLSNYAIFEQFMNPALEPDLDRIKTQSFSFVVN